MKVYEFSNKYKGVKCNGGKRAKRSIKWVVIHDTEGSSAEGAAAYLKDRPDGSAHVVLGENDAWVLASPSTITCGTGGFNSPTYHIEQPGFAHYSRAQWLRNFRQLRRVAYWTAAMCYRLDLPARYRTAQDLRAGRAGYTTHARVTESGLGTTTHVDPGRHYPFDKRNGVKALIRGYYLVFKLKDAAKLKRRRA